MHVYVEPLVDELKRLWVSGVSVVDVSAKPEEQKFTLRAILIQTMHDFPGVIPKINGYSHFFH